MKMGQNKRKTDSLLVLLLFGVFAVCILSVLLTGAGAYRRLADRDRESYDQRTAVQYLATKIRQADRTGAVTVGDFEGQDALILTEEFDGEAYETRIYCHDGYICELFAAAGGDFLPQDGEKILPAKNLLIDKENPGLRIRILTEQEAWEELFLTLRSGKEAAA